jgi:hypothetical protein
MVAGSWCFFAGEQQFAMPYTSNQQPWLPVRGVFAEEQPPAMPYTSNQQPVTSNHSS